MATSQSAFSGACFTVLGSKWARNKVGCSLGLWIPDLDLVCIGWVLTGIELGAETNSEEDAPGVVNSEVWGWIDVEEVDGWDTRREVVGEWIGIGEKPGGARGTKGEWEGDSWEDGGLGTIEGGDRLGLRLK